MKKDNIKLTNEQALAIVAAMVKDSADEFEQGAKLYLDGLRDVERAKKTIKTGLGLYAAGRTKMHRGAQAVTSEVAFLEGKEKISPIIDGEYVMVELIRRVYSRMNDITVPELLKLIQDVTLSITGPNQQ